MSAAGTMSHARPLMRKKANAPTPAYLSHFFFLLGWTSGDTLGGMILNHTTIVVLAANALAVWNLKNCAPGY